MNPVYHYEKFIIQTQKTDEEIFREEKIQRCIELTEDLKKNVKIAFDESLEKIRSQMRSQNNVLLKNNNLLKNNILLKKNVLLKRREAIASMADQMDLIPRTLLLNLLCNQAPVIAILELNLKKMQMFFTSKLSLEIRKQLTTLFPVEKEKLKVVEVSLIPSLLKDIKKIFKDLERLNPEFTRDVVSTEMGFCKEEFDKIFTNRTSIFLQHTQIENVRTFAQKHLKKVENAYPILFSKKLLEIGNDILFDSSEAPHSVSLIQTPVISNNNALISTNAQPTPKKRLFNQIHNPLQEQLTASSSGDSSLMHQNNVNRVPAKGGNKPFTPLPPPFPSFPQRLKSTTVLSNYNPTNCTSSSSAPQKTSVDHSLGKEAPSPSLKQQEVNETPSIPSQISQENDNMTTKSSSALIDTMEVEIIPKGQETVAELEHPELFEAFWKTEGYN